MPATAAPSKDPNWKCVEEFVADQRALKRREFFNGIEPADALEIGKSLALQGLKARTRFDDGIRNIHFTKNVRSEPAIVGSGFNNLGNAFALEPKGQHLA